MLPPLAAIATVRGLLSSSCQLLQLWPEHGEPIHRQIRPSLWSWYRPALPPAVIAIVRGFWSSLCQPGQLSPEQATPVER